MIKGRLWTFLLLCAIALAPMPGHADDDDKVMDRLRAAVSRGEALPLSTLQERLSKAFPGQIVGVEVEDKKGRFIYEFKVLQANGRLLEIEMDAASAAVLEVEND
jgi:uncharacterized membrane protein YkoI